MSHSPKWFCVCGLCFGAGIVASMLATNDSFTSAEAADPTRAANTTGIVPQVDLLTKRVDALEQMVHRDKGGKAVLAVDEIEMTGDTLAITKDHKTIVRVSVTKANKYDYRAPGMNENDREETRSLEVFNEKDKPVIHLTTFPSREFTLADGQKGFVSGPAMIGIRSNVQQHEGGDPIDLIFLTTYPGWLLDGVGDAQMIIRDPEKGAMYTRFGRKGVNGRLP